MSHIIRGNELRKNSRSFIMKEGIKLKKAINGKKNKLDEQMKIYKEFMLLKHIHR